MPAMAGLQFPWTKEPKFKTRRQEAVSGREVRIADWAYPRYTWTLDYSALRQGILSGGSFTELAQFEGFFENLLGGWDSFLYQDADDYTVTAQGIGTGDGSTKNFPLIRAFGNFVIPVLAPNLVATYNVYLNGVAQSHPSQYSITPWGTSDPNGPGVIEFVTAPGATVAITATFQYYFPCRFDADTLTFKKFLAAVYSLSKVSFTSIK